MRIAMKLIVVAAILFTAVPQTVRAADPFEAREVTDANVCPFLGPSFVFACMVCFSAPDTPMIYMGGFHRELGKISHCVERFPQREPSFSQSEYTGILLRKPEYDHRCAQMDIPPGATCKGGVVTPLVVIYEEAPQVIPDRCAVTETSPGSVCINGNIINLAEIGELPTFPIDICSYMDVPAGSECDNGIIIPRLVLEKMQHSRKDPCTFMEVATGSQCVGGAVSSSFDTGQSKLTSERGDDWREREDLLANRKRLQEALERNSQIEAMIAFREAGSYIVMVARFEYTRFKTMKSMDKKPITGFYKLIMGAFNLPEQIEAIEKQYDKERAENRAEKEKFLRQLADINANIRQNEQDRADANNQAETDRQNRLLGEVRKRAEDRRRLDDERRRMEDEQRRRDNEKQAAEERKRQINKERLRREKAKPTEAEPVSEPWKKETTPANERKPVKEPRIILQKRS